MKLWPAEGVSSDTGGFIAELPSGVTKAVAWRSNAPIEPTLDAAKQYVTALIQALLDGRHLDDVERTNWASATAAVQKIVADWNEKTRARLYAERPPSVPYAH